MRFPRRTMTVMVLMAAITVSGDHRLWAQASLPDAPAATAAPAPQETTPAPAKTRQEEAAEQVKEEEHQRILGVVPSFEVTDNRNALPLTVGQKFNVAFHSAVDPAAFVTAALDGALGQALDQFSGYGQGAAGYGKRVGAAYADSFDGTMLGNAVFPSLLHEDPRYFRMGAGPFKKRILHALSSPVWARRDNLTWGFNYANISGNLVAGGLSNLYYPASDRGIGLTFERAFTVTAEGGLGTLGVEFWPDVSRRIFHGRGAGKTATAPTP